MDISVSYYSAIGKRQNNEDSVSMLESNHGLLAIVADGLGGHADGEVASRQAIETMNRLLQSQTPDKNLLMAAIQQANRDILGQSRSESPMHTTVASLWLGDDQAVAAHVGDSRIYQFRGGSIVFQSRDHSVAQMAVLIGEMDQSEIRTCKDRNKLIRVLGCSESPKVDSTVLSVQEGDRFLLCSDGFWEAVTEADMLRTIAVTDTAQQWLGSMRRIVEDSANPTQDNHTAITLIINRMR